MLKISGVIEQNFAARATRQPRLVHPYYMTTSEESVGASAYRTTRNSMYKQEDG